MSINCLPSALRTRAGWSEYLESKRSSQPFVHQIEPTNHCPYTCVMCPRSRHMTRPLGFMDMELFRKVIDEIAGFSEPVRSREIELFHFGESLLHPQLPEMVEYATARGLNTSLSVNAPELTPERAARLLAARPARLVVSLDGHDAESYRLIRGEAAHYELAAANVRQLIDLLHRETRPVPVTLRIIRLKSTEPFLDSFLRHWEEAGIEVEIRPFFPWSEAELVSLGEVEKYPPGMPCPFPWQYLVVQWDGTVVPCCRDYNAQNPLGNVRDRSLREIWNSEQYAGLRRQHAAGCYDGNEFCQSCMKIYFTEPASGITDDSCEPLPLPASATMVSVPLSPADLAPGMAGAPQSFPDLWEEAQRLYADQPLMVSDQDGGVLSYGEADSLVRLVRDRLAAAGVVPGDRIALLAHQHPEAALLCWGVLLLGATLVPLDHRLAPPALAGLIERTAPRLIFCDRERLDSLPAADRSPVVLLDDQDESNGTGPAFFSQWLEQAAGGEPPESSTPSPDDPALIMFTSGTSGEAKGVVLSQGALCRSGWLMARCYGWGPGDTVLSLGDFHTMSGLRNPLFGAVSGGSCFVVASGAARSSAPAVAGVIGRHGVTQLTTVPAMLRQFALLGSRIDRGETASLRQVLCTGTLLPPALGEAFQAATGLGVLNYYGLTETAGLCIGELPGRQPAGPGAIGVPLGCEVRIVGKDGLPVEADGVGELQLRTPNLMTGYHGAPPPSEGAPGDHWYRTGDLARLLPGGEVVLIDRLGDLVKDAGGEFFCPAEIEQALESHPEVAEAAVAPLRGAQGELELVACLVTASPAPLSARLIEELRHYLAMRLPPARVPARFRQLSELPRGNNGKLLRRQLPGLLSPQEEIHVPD